MIQPAPFLSLHALHAFPPGCMNRDREGAINKIRLGGTTRVRVSSRAGRRAMRTHIRQHAIDGGVFGVRTNRLPAAVVDAVDPAVGDRDQITAKVAAVFTSLGLKLSDKNGNTKAMVFVAPDTADKIATVVTDHADKIGDEVPDDVTAAARAAFDVHNVIDIALFGRMISEIPAATLPGAVNAAHDISVAPAGIEADFWTAVDDLRPDNEPGSNNLGWADLSAPIMYRYVAIDRRQLATNLAHAPHNTIADAERAVVDAFIQALPTGKRTNTASTTLPEFVIAVESGRDTNAVNAFTNAVTDPHVLPTATSRLVDTLTRAQQWLPNSRVRVLPVTCDPNQFPLPEQWTMVTSIDELIGHP